MSQLIETVTATGGHHDSLIGIERVGGTYWKEWDRYLLLRGERAYHIGNICNTCAFFFQRLEGANKSLSLAKVVAALDAGLSGLTGPVPTTVLAQLPPATYDVLLLRAAPQLISPHDADDYFDAEQRALWGKDSFRGRDGRTEYYRLGSRRIASNTQLFEFLIPLYPHTRLGEAVERHRQQLTAGRTPTAVAISFLDV